MHTSSAAKTTIARSNMSAETINAFWRTTQSPQTVVRAPPRADAIKRRSCCLSSLRYGGGNVRPGSRVYTVTEPNRKKLFFKIALTVLILIFAVGLMAYTISRSAGTYLKVDQLVAQPNKWRAKTVWLGGRLVENSLVSPKDGTKDRIQESHRFTLEWKGKRITVHYRGTLPPAFVAGKQITARGQLRSSGAFEAEQITTRCPSKYKSKGTL